MTQNDAASKVEVLLEAMPYLQRFKQSIFVLKLGGAFMESPEAQASVATDLVFLATVGIRVVVVHGGGKAISRAMEKSGLQPVFKNGMRVTDAQTVELVGKTLDVEINSDLCEVTRSRGGAPKGFAGRNLMICRKLEKDDVGNPIDLGFVGDVTAVETGPILEALNAGLIPIISPTASDTTGQVYNTNADVAASHVAIALKARRLVYFCDVPGLLSNPKDPESLISTLKVDAVAQLKQDGIISSGMAPKVDSAVRALQQGVNRVHFIDGRMPHSCLLEMFTDQGIGTEIVHV
jgi:acetylglutamate kinase